MKMVTVSCWVAEYPVITIRVQAVMRKCKSISSVSFQDFSGKLLRQGVSVRESRGRLSYLTPDRTKPITARRLGDDFDRAAVLERLARNAQEAARAAEKPASTQEYPRSIRERLQLGKAAINARQQGAPERETVQRMVDIEAKRAEGKGIGYEKWAALHNLKQMAASVNIYKEAGFASLEELEAALAAANTGLETARIKLKGVENNLREKKELQQQLAAYIRTKPARDGLKAQKSEKARAAYRQQHHRHQVCKGLHIRVIGQPGHRRPLVGL